MEKYIEDDYEYIQYHIDDDILVIKYYFEETEEPNPDTNPNPTYTWTTDICQYYISQGMSEVDAMECAESTVAEIKSAYAASMEKWNNIYYYSYDENGNIMSNKIITVVEGTKLDHNLSIYPMDYITAGDTVANAVRDGICEDIPNDIPGLSHLHYSNYKMHVNVNLFFEHNSFEINNYEISSVSFELANKLKDYVGQHELGHVLGLFDVDVCCNALQYVEHHEELLMGYAGYGAGYATYKDIAGVSITRGFHTDDDHIWMMRTRANGMKDVICALCNGVRYNVDTSLDSDGNCLYNGEVHNTYQSCVHHGGANEKMLLVATDGERDFFKCLYCRHIEEVQIINSGVATKYQGFTLYDTVSAKTTKYLKLTISHDETYNFKVTSYRALFMDLYDAELKNTNLFTDDIYTENGYNITLTVGTYYIRIQNNYYSDNNISISVNPPPHIHEYTDYTYYSPTQHIECCECGQKGTQKGSHIVQEGSVVNYKGICMYCRATVFILDNHFPGLMSVTRYSINGSYILPNGIIVLVDEDIEAYENGTLVFYDKDNLPQTQ